MKKSYSLHPLTPHHADRWEYTLNLDGSICLQCYHGSRPELQIPDMFMGRPVTALGNDFGGPHYMCTAIIPDTVLRIGSHAFSSDHFLTQVWIPTSVTHIADTAFADLQELCICTPAGSCAHVFAIDHGIDCRTDVLPDPVDEALAALSSGDWLYHPTESGEALLLEYCGHEACLQVPAALDGYPVREVMPACFCGNAFLQELTLPEGLTSIGQFAFRSCPALRRVHIPDSVTHLGSGAFSECTDLEDVRLSPALDTLHMTVFLNCTSLKRIALPTQLRLIGPLAFGGCTALEELLLNSGLRSVIRSALWNCPRLRRPDHLPDSLDEDARALFSDLPL